MRHSFLALFAVLLGGASAHAQSAAPPQPADQDQLNAVIQRWEKEMASVRTLAAQCVRTEVNRTFGYTEVFTGVARYMKLDVGGRIANLALLEMMKKDRPEVVEKFICTGDLLYQFVSQQKEIRVHQLPASRPGQVSDDNFFSFLFGMKAEVARQRYEMTLQMPNDPNYIYLLIKPRTPQDRADFQQARLVLRRDTFLPRQLWFEQPTGDHVTWDIPKIENGAQLDRREFVAPDTPPGWKMVRVQPKNVEAQPRIYRPQQP
jgi:TIGR03009 family protein